MVGTGRDDRHRYRCRRWWPATEVVVGSGGGGRRRKGEGDDFLCVLGILKCVDKKL